MKYVPPGNPGAPADVLGGGMHFVVRSEICAMNEEITNEPF